MTFSENAAVPELFDILRHPFQSILEAYPPDL